VNVASLHVDVRSPDGHPRIFDDVSTGGGYGSFVIGNANEGNVLEIRLNASAPSDINELAGSLFAICGSPKTIAGSKPKPGSLALAALDLPGIALILRHCRYCLFAPTTAAADSRGR
jgi:hypothetical protein